MAARPQLESLLFWGKVQTLSKNYYIMLGMTFSKVYEFPRKAFFWASNDFVFKELPELLLQHEGLAQKIIAPFSGDPNKQLVKLEAEAEAEGQPPELAEKPADSTKIEEDEDVKKAPKKNFLEIHRLTFIVRAIEFDVQIIPKGAFRLTPEHQTHPNREFQGLLKEDALNPSSWLHLRAPQTENGLRAIEAETAFFNQGFLESIENDKPVGCWAIHSDLRKQTVSVRSLIWPGYFCFHTLGTPYYGSVYIGDGLKNVDLPFMI